MGLLMDGLVIGPPTHDPAPVEGSAGSGLLKGLFDVTSMSPGEAATMVVMYLGLV